MLIIKIVLILQTYFLNEKVDRFKQFILAINDLPLGITEYEFTIGNWFFDNFDFSEIKKGDIKIKLSLEKKEKMYILDFNINGFAEVICDRCNEYYNEPIIGSNCLIINVVSKASNLIDNEDNVEILDNQTHFNIGHYIYEYISILLPMKHIHPTDKNGNTLCNKETLKLLKKLSINKKDNDMTDPRWDVLKNFKLDN